VICRVVGVAVLTGTRPNVAGIGAWPLVGEADDVGVGVGVGEAEVSGEPPPPQPRLSTTVTVVSSTRTPMTGAGGSTRISS